MAYAKAGFGPLFKPSSNLPSQIINNFRMISSISRGLLGFLFVQLNLEKVTPNEFYTCNWLSLIAGIRLIIDVLSL